jgi:serine phosphatase RsbU (regulator of sigma subunit)/transcriptional regulator with GAF, ATPase, and Fis domain
MAAVVMLALLIHRRYRERRLLDQRMAELGALSEAGRAIVAAQLDVDELCMLIYRQAHKIVDTWIFQLGLFEGDAYRIKVWIVRGSRQPEAVFDLSEDEGIVGWMRRTGQALLVYDFEKERETLPARPRYLSEDPPRSAAFVPLVAGELVIGAIAIQSYRPAAFTQDHLRILSIIANQAAAAIVNARLYEAEQRRRQLADKLREVSSLINASLEMDQVLEAILDALDRLVSFDAGVILFAEGGSFTLRAARGAEGLAQVVGQHWPMTGARSLRQLADAPGAVMFGPDDEIGAHHQLLGYPADHSCLGAPLAIRDQFIGVICLEHRQREAFDAEDVAAVTSVADQAASALENARLYAAGQEEAWISTALLEVAEAISVANDLDEVLKTVVRITPLLVGVDHCAVLIWSEEELALEVVAAYEPPEGQGGFLVGQVIAPDSLPLLERLWETGSPVVDEFGALPGTPDLQDEDTTLLALPLRAQGELMGAMIIRFTGQISFSEHRIKLIAGIANQAGLAIESAQLDAAQQEEAWVSMALLQVAEAVANLAELDEVLAVVTRLTALLVGVESCLVYLWQPAREVFTPGAVFGLDQSLLGRFHSTSIPVDAWPQITTGSATDGLDIASAAQSYVSDTWESREQPIWVVNAPSRLTDALDLQHALSLPLSALGETVGAMVVDSHSGPLHLRGRRLSILTGVAQQTATAVRSARLQLESVERQKLEQELLVARQIQASFLPDTAPAIEGWDLAAYWEGARQVSGDFYDFIPLGRDKGADERWGFVVADVADKGVPAALFMALSRTLVRTMAVGGSNPAQVLAEANDLIMTNARSDLFVTLFYAILEVDHGLITFANAGHNPPLLFNGHSEAIGCLTGRGMALGVVLGVDLEQRESRMAPGDLLLLYTDGVTDALNSSTEEFGLDRLCAVVKAHQTESAADIVRSINQAVDEFVGDTPQFDDLTLMILKREDHQLS